MKSRSKRPDPKKKRKLERELTRWEHVLGGLGLILLAGLWISSFFPEGRLWGVNHWAYFPLWLRTLVIAATLPLFVPQVNRGVRNLLRASLSQFLDSLMVRRRYLAYVLTATASLAAFFLLRVKAPLLGDGFQILENINAGALSVNWSQPLAIWIYLSCFKLLNQLFHLDGAGVYALISYLSGLIYVVFALKMALLLTKKPSTQLFVFLILMCMGSAQLFFGYAEHYPLLCSGILIYLFYSLKFLRGEGGILTPVIIFLVLLPLHFSSFYLFPSMLILLLFRERGQRLPQLIRGKQAVVALCFMLLLLAVLVVYVRQQRWFAFSYFVPLLHGGYTGPGYTLFSPAHILDFINQQLLISPIGLVLLLAFLALKPRYPSVKDRIFLFLLTVTAAQLLFNFVVNPGLGAPRDWDLFAATGLGYTLLALYLLSGLAADAKLGPLKLQLTTVALLFVMPWIFLNAAPQESVARFRNLLELDPGKSRNGHFILAAYFDRAGKPEEVDRENRRIAEKFPEVELTNQGHVFLQHAELDSAYQRFAKAIRTAPDFAEAHAGLSWYYYRTGKLQQCEQELKKALQLKPDYQQAYVTLGEIRMQRGDFKKARECFTRALKLGIEDPQMFNNLGILCVQFGDLDKAALFYRKAIARKKDFPEPRYGLAHVYHQQGNLEESLRQINQLLQIAPDFALGYYQLGLVCEALGRRKEAASAYERYLQMEPHTPKADYIEQLIQRLKAE
jgi:tetratricopeptide (TPR) repeat protein